MFSYTFIIPHKNSPELLQRCLDSIPEREDVQIIIVDDNSDSRKVDFCHFPGISRENTEVIFDKTNKGAGHARNLGLKRAIGEWVLFADADDFYKEGFLNYFDQYIGSDCDVIYFDFVRVDSDSLKECRKEIDYTSEIMKYNNSKNDYFFRFCFNPPWNKMIKKHLINSNNIEFEEVKQGNDTMFTLQVGYYSKRRIIINERLYYYTLTPNSITQKKWRTEDYLLSIENLMKKNKFLEAVGLDKHKESLIILILHFLRRKGAREFFKVLLILIRNHKYLKSIEMKYVNVILR